jgi:hypothetical protein
MFKQEAFYLRGNRGQNFPKALSLAKLATAKDLQLKRTAKILQLKKKHTAAKDGIGLR